MKSCKKYSPFSGPRLRHRKWPNHKITQAPIWASVDLRDGNQALPIPMTVTKKIGMFRMLVAMGFKQIEVGFPAASETEFRFVRALIEQGLIPDDVTIQVLVQAREDLIQRTVEALRGCKKVIIHLYNSTSPAQRRIVFGLTKSSIIDLAVRGVEWIKKYSASLSGTKVTLQYSPESFSATEVAFSLQVCRAVMNAWGVTPRRRIILNLPATVEVAIPNVYADQIEWFCNHLSRLERQSVVISVHTHNDRGTGVAATELALLAGADRVEGTLFGNGERTGNVDIITVALNLFSHGINPRLKVFDINRIRKGYEKWTGMRVHERHPYAGELVFTAFSGSHQDAIRKGLAEQAKGGREHWDVPYLTIDPIDIGREYEEVIRYNAQSGNAGVAHLLERKGIRLPKGMQREFGSVAKKAVDKNKCEASATYLLEMFRREYLRGRKPYSFVNSSGKNLGGKGKKSFHSNSHIHFEGKTFRLVGVGNGPVDAFINAFNRWANTEIEILEYREESLGQSSQAKAISYIHLKCPDGKTRWGAGVDTDIMKATLRAIVSALNRYVAST